MTTLVTRAPGIALPDIASARLPQAYVTACAALESCSRLDECQDWADKAEALASYAKQSHDDTLRTMADRIQARAIRRAGELLKEIAPSVGGRPAEKTCVGAHTGSSRSQAARDAGMSKHQKDTALRVASVPVDEFESAVDSDDPPTVTQLAKHGTTPKPQPEPWMVEMARDQRRPGFQEATALIGALRVIVECCAEHEPAVVRSGMSQTERHDTLAQWATVLEWFQQFTGVGDNV